MPTKNNFNFLYLNHYKYFNIKTTDSKLIQKLYLRLSYIREDGFKALFNQNQLTNKIIR